METGHTPGTIAAVYQTPNEPSRHWSVFFSGTTTAIIFWVITPLLGATFADSRQSQTIESTASTVASLVSGISNTFELDVSVIADGYGITWLGQDLPSAVTTSGTIAQFTLDRGMEDERDAATWTAETEFYSTQLNCVPAKMDEGSIAGRIFDNGNGCRTETVVSTGKEGYNAFYIGYYNNPNVDYSLEALGCSSDASRTFLAVWASVKNYTFEDVTAIFCEPTYLVQKVNATTEALNGTVSSIVPLGPPIALQEDRFNASDFEYLVGAGTKAVIPVADIPGTNTLEQFPMLRGLNMNIEWPISDMVGFAVGATKLPPDDYFNTTVLASSYQAAHQLLFALAAAKVFSNDTPALERRPGLITSQARSVIVVQELAIVVEVMLGLVTIFILALLLLSSGRRSGLIKDPASLSDLMQLAKSLGSRPMESLQDSDRLKLRKGQLLLAKGNTSKEKAHATTPTATSLKDMESSLVRPFEMNLAVGAAFLLALLLAIATLTVVFREITRNNGLHLPSTSEAVNQLALNYVPIAFATFLEPLWTLLNRLLCILQPFEALRRGQARPSQSLDIKYTALPPQLVFWRALRARHLILVAVCLVGLSANFLAVSLGALFSTNPTQLRYPSDFIPRLIPELNETLPVDGQLFGGDEGSSEVYRDHFYVARSNITKGTPLPAWTSPHNVFMPFDIDKTSMQKEASLYQAATQSVRFNVSCEEIITTGNGAASNAYQITQVPNHFGLPSQMGLAITEKDGTTIQCSTQTFGGRQISGVFNGSFASEQTSVLRSESSDPSPREKGICSQILTVAFLRANLTTKFDAFRGEVNPIAKHEASRAVYIACKPKLQVADVEVTVDAGGRVQNYVQTSSFKDSDASIIPRGNLSYVYESINDALWSGEVSRLAEVWHADLMAVNWLPYLIKARTQSTDFLNPALPPPTFESVGPVIEDIYSRLFAILVGLQVDAYFVPAAEGALIPGTRIETTTRVFMSKPMFIVSIVLLVLNVLVAILYYTKRPQRMLKKADFLESGASLNQSYCGLPQSIDETMRFDREEKGLSDALAKGDNKARSDVVGSLRDQMLTFLQRYMIYVSTGHLKTLSSASILKA
ncbi:MAG: hypothetical protein Q9183_002747 [Haloplaca sp. 2 TL-2023]